MTIPARRALQYEFELSVDGGGALEEYLDGLFHALPLATSPEPVPWRLKPVDGTDKTGWELMVGEECQSRAESAERLVHDVVHQLNAIAIPGWDGVVCHAGGVTRGALGVVLPADMESGKTTLTAGLVRAGFGYLTDEGVAFHRGGRLIEPYAKPLSIDPGSQFLFPELEPDAPLANDEYKTMQWQVPPRAFREGAVGAPCDVGVIVFPNYEEGARSELVPVRPAEALVEMAKNTFSFNTDSRAALDELVVIVRAVPSYRLTVGSLDEAVGIIEELTADV